MSKKYRRLKTILKVSMWTLVSIISLIIIFLVAIVWILSPSQLTPLAEKYANEYLDANVKIEKAELTVWKTFPYATIDIDGLTVVSKGLKSLTAAQKATLPVYADTLLEVRGFHAGINLLKLPLGKIALQDLMLDSPKINLVAYSKTVANYNIVPPSSTSDSVPLTIPDLSLNSFEMANCRSINYFSAQDSMAVSLHIAAAQVTETETKKFQMLFDGKTSVTLAGQPILADFPFKINGIIDWNYKKPLDISLNDWKMTLLDFPVTCNLAMNLDSKPLVSKLNMSMGPIKMSSIMPLIPAEYLKFIKGVSTDLNASMKLSLTKPYNLAGSDLPSINLDFIVPNSYVQMADGNRINRFTIDANVRLNGAALDSSIVTINNLALDGKAIDIDIKGKVSNLISNAHVIGEVKGSVDISKAIKIFKIPLSFSVRGNLEADAKIDARKNDMNKKSFHRMKIDGNVDLSNFFFHNPAQALNVYARRANLTFGASSTAVTGGGRRIKGVTMASATIDTLSMVSPGMDVCLRNGKLSGGIVCKPTEMLDTTKIIPLGVSLKAQRVKVIDTTDSSIIRLHDLICSSNIRRSINNKRLPHIGLEISASQASYGNSTTRMSLKEGDIKLETNPRAVDANFSRINKRINARIDSLSKIYPTLSRDSIMVLARKRRVKAMKDSDEIIDFSVDSKFKELLRKWQMKGSIKAKRGRLFTPFFPLRNTLSDIDFDFSADSFIVNHMHYKTGQSIFEVKGGVRNIRTALLGRNRKPLSVHFSINSDTLDVNELIKAAFSGAAYADNIAARYKLGTSESEEELELLAANANADTTLTAIVVPGNIDADIDIFSKYAIYADMVVNDATGCIQVHDGVLQFNDMVAKSDMGDMRFNALYVAPTKHKIKFAFDLGLKDILVKRFLTMIPAIDTIMPLLQSMDGIIDADIAATTEVDSAMNILLPTFKAAVKLHGDSLVLFDSEVFAKLSKMMLFKNKQRNYIDNMTVELLIHDSQLELFPFMFDLDRYRFGIMGHNDMALNLKYHISVLKSPIPFKFGINITGNANDKMKFRFGGAKFKENHVSELGKIVDTTRINLREQIRSTFQRGANAALTSTLNVKDAKNVHKVLEDNDTLTHADSLAMMDNGLIERPPVVLTPEQLKAKEKADKKAEKLRKKQEKKQEKERKRRKDMKREDVAWIERRQK
ncbi:MAG: hypothetical protein RSB34_06930 [Muribaculaceae bacterium]